MTWWDEDKWNADMVIRALHDLRRWGEVTYWHSDSSTCWLEDLWRSDKLTCGKQEIWLVTRWSAEMPRNEKMTTWDLRRRPAEKWHMEIWLVENWQMQLLKYNIWLAGIWNPTTDIHIPEKWSTEMLKCELVTQWLDEKWLGDLVTWWEHRNWDVT